MRTIARPVSGPVHACPRLNREVAPHELFLSDRSWRGSQPRRHGCKLFNTGGSRLLRYGDVRRSLLGLEVILPDADATVLCDLTGLRKDNSGIDLKHLFVGTSGSLGIITRVQVELQRLPRQAAAALIIPTTHAAVPHLLTALEAEAGEFLSAFEGMSANALEAAFTHNRRLRNPFSGGELPAYAVLVGGWSPACRPDRWICQTCLTQLLVRLMEQHDPLVKDACFGRPEDFWAIRHSISDGLRDYGPVVGFDISVARSRLLALRAGS